MAGAQRIRTLFALFFALAGSRAIAAYGDQVGTFNGVIAYSNGSATYNSGSHNTVNGYTTGLKWQCVEYVRRYYFVAYGLQIGAGMNADGFYGNGWGLTKAANGGSTPPVPGAILCSNSNTNGHIAIVREVGPNYIKVIQQNWSENSDDNAHQFSMTVSNGTYRVNQAGSYSWQGWLMPPNSGGTASTIAWTDVPQDGRWYRSDERLVYHVDGDRPNTVRELIDGNNTATYDTSDGYIRLSYGPTGWHFYETAAQNAASGGNYAYTGRWNGGWDPDPPTATRSGGAEPNVWYQTSTSVSFSCADALSGIRYCHYKWDDGAYSEWARVDNGTVPLLPGKHHLYVEAEDNSFTGSNELGNRSTVDLGEFWLDTTAGSVNVSARLVSTGTATQVELTVTNPNPSPLNNVGVDLVQFGFAKSSELPWTINDLGGGATVKKTFSFSTGFGSNKSMLISANYHLGSVQRRIRTRVARL